LVPKFVSDQACSSPWHRFPELQGYNPFINGDSYDYEEEEAEEDEYEDDYENEE